MNGKGRQLSHRLQIVIQCLLCLPTLAAATQLANGHHGLCVERQPNRAVVRVRLAIDAMNGLEDRVGSSALTKTDPVLLG